MQELLDQTDERMAATVKDFMGKLATIRTGRASLGILDGVRVEYYGTPSPLNQVAKLSVPEPSLIVAQPFDPTMMQEVEKAIQAAGLGLNPSNDGKVIRIPIPPLTEERRKEMVKRAHQMREVLQRQTQEDAGGDDGQRAFRERTKYCADHGSAPASP